MAPTPAITFYFLQASRAIRIAWLLEELSLPYTLERSERMANNLAPAEFKEKIGTRLGKSPAIRDGPVVVQESGAITEYLCRRYDAADATGLMGGGDDLAQQAKVLEWINAAEGTFMVHGLAALYARLHMPAAAKADGTLAQLEKGLGINLHKDFEWLDAELAAGSGKYLVGDKLTAADTMMHFSIQFLFTRGLGGVHRDGTYPHAEKWLDGLESEPGYKKAVERTGYKL